MLPQIEVASEPTVKDKFGTAFTVTVTVSSSVSVQEPKGVFIALTDNVAFAVSTAELKVMVPPVPKTEDPELAESVLLNIWYITPA